MTELCCENLSAWCIWYSIQVCDITKTYSQIHYMTKRFHNTTHSFGKLGYMVTCSHKFVCYSDLKFRYRPCFEKRGPWSSGKLRVKLQSIQVCGMTKTYSQIHNTDKFSKHSSINWPVWLNGWVFTYKLNCWRFKSCYSHFKCSVSTNLFLWWLLCTHKGVSQAICKCWTSLLNLVWFEIDELMWIFKNVFRLC